MKTKAVRLYGEDDLRLEEFELPEMGEDEILAEVISDSLCMSSYKATSQGARHKRVPDDVADNPVIIGHEFAGKILEVGKNWKHKFKSGDKFTVQPAMEVTMEAAGYSFRWFGGNATHVIIPSIYLEQDCIIPFEADSYYMSSLAEPYSCVAGTFEAHFHTKYGTYVHEMGIRNGGSMAMLGAAGPMGVAAIDYIIHTDRRPSLLVVTDIDQERLDYLAGVITKKEASVNGIELLYVNTTDKDTNFLRSLTPDEKGYDDILVFAAVKPVVEQADELLAFDGCLNFFAGPADIGFKAEINFYKQHYNFTHFVATSGGNTDDIRRSIKMMVEGSLSPQYLVSHVGGLDSVMYATCRLPQLPGAKKLIYTQISMPLTAINDFEEMGKKDPLFNELHKICAKNEGLWSPAAEKYLLINAKPI
ncbi:MAG TPA: L-sorbose 1-phosphate reductase [Bacteroides sp.]|nr:L-sorbose 1-phosphate reductase [Bacteroides sp.]